MSNSRRRRNPDRLCRCNRYFLRGEVAEQFAQRIRSQRFVQYGQATVAHLLEPIRHRIPGDDDARYVAAVMGA